MGIQILFHHPAKAQEILGLLAFILAVLLGNAFNANAVTLNIPQDYPTIQAGIAEAADGDTVLIAPWTYVGRVSLHVKSNDG